MIPALLLALAATDVAFVGYRVAAGTNPMIRKSAFYRGAVARGVVAGLIPIVANVALVLILLATAADGAALYRALVVAGTRMVWIYGAYAALVILAFVPYLFAPLDFRVLASVAIFGPLTLLRPAVIAGGAAVALIGVTDWRVGIAVAIAAGSMVAFEPVLARARKNFDLEIALVRSGRSR